MQGAVFTAPYLNSFSERSVIMNAFDIIIIGGGPAGLTAAIYAARIGKKVLVLERNVLGGQITYAPLVENYPGIAHLNGSEFAAVLEEQASSFGAIISYEEAIQVISNNDHVFTVCTDCASYEANAVILAVGSAHKQLGLPNEEALIGAGVSYCSVCDGAFYADKEVAVVGGGNAAVQEALFLSTLCKKVHLIHRRNQLRADSCTVERVLQNDKITLHTPYVVDTLQEQEEQLTGLLLKNQENNSIQKLDVEGVFIAIGQKPDNAPFANLNICSSQGYIQAEADTLTSVPGLFAAGDCRNKKIRQLTTACGDGTIAAMAACKFLEN